MSDLLAPVLAVMDHQADAFWCFVGYMDLMVCAAGDTGLLLYGLVTIMYTDVACVKHHYLPALPRNRHMRSGTRRLGYQRTSGLSAS